MKYFHWICCLLWESLPSLTAFPISSTIHSDDAQEYDSWSWEQHWISYTIGLFSVTATALTLAGCLCCRRHRKPKGFQEFKDGSTPGHDRSLEHMQGVELEVPRTISLSEAVQFEPIAVEHILREQKLPLKPKPPPPSPSMFLEDHDQDRSILQETCKDWFDATEYHIPREKLKYLREIGRGWFGKVVEGHAELNDLKVIPKTGNVVVRILTEEATTKEKIWFLGESTPYLKLRHPNIMTLLGICLDTDPYLLLFESCAAGDLKGFLLSNSDTKSREALIKENLPIRMAVDIATGLRHMHDHGFAHTDLSARNCLVGADLSAKLGDYGTGVEKYPDDYYIIGDRALPIRWSAPESIVYTESTIETREITTQANIWSYGVLLWEIFKWGERPYDDKSNEHVIQMLLSLRSTSTKTDAMLLNDRSEDIPANVLQAIELCLPLDINKRPSLDTIRRALLNERIEEDFEQRWENLRPNTSKFLARSASLQNLRGSIDSECWPSFVEEKHSGTLSAAFRLGPYDPVKNLPDVIQVGDFHESGSETEEESWRGRVERGAYTEKVKQKSKSVADLMVLVHIDSDSDAELSMGPQSIGDKSKKKRLPTTGSDSDLISAVLADEFDETLKKLRHPLSNNATRTTDISESTEKPKLLTLTTDQGQTPILRLSLNSSTSMPNDQQIDTDTTTERSRTGEHVLRLFSKSNQDLPLFRYVTNDELTGSNTDDNCPVVDSETNKSCTLGNHSSSNKEQKIDKSTAIDVDLWNDALESALEHKVPGFSAELEFNEFDETFTSQKDSNSTPELVVTLASAPGTPQSGGNYSMGNADDSNNTDDLEMEEKDMPNVDEDERKRLSTPDDERSSDSGFRDKESCEDEESPYPPPSNHTSVETTKTTESVNEDEQLRILFELDTILDAEYYSTMPESNKSADNLFHVQNLDNTVLNLDEPCATYVIEDVEGLKSEQSDDLNIDSDTKNNNEQTDEWKSECKSEDLRPKEILGHAELISDALSDDKTPSRDTDRENNDLPNDNDLSNLQELEHWMRKDYENEDEDSSTVSLRSDNSYVSFSLEEEYVNAIRNELKEKLPKAQMPVVETVELHDDEKSFIANNVEVKSWEEEESEGMNEGSGIDIAIRYNIYGTPLSPILEERESTLTSESLISNSRDISFDSKDTVQSEDVLVVDTRTNEMVLLEGLQDRLKIEDDHADTTNEEMSEDENTDYNPVIAHSHESSRRISGCGGAPLPSPEEETKWQQLPPPYSLPPLPHEDDLISTNFGTDGGWESPDEDEDPDVDEDEEEDEENSSSSGEFVWKRYDEPNAEEVQIRSTANNDEESKENEDADDQMEGEDDEEEEEFTPSAWNATLVPHRSALRSPDKTQKSGDQKKSVWFKKQRYHCVYEYPKETVSSFDNQGETTTTTWTPTSYSDWEDMMDEPKLDLYSLDYDDANHTGDDEFYVSSSNRPFQFQSTDSKYVSQFFPGASSTSNQVNNQDQDCNSKPQEQQDEKIQSNESENMESQLGKLRHTRDKLKLNLPLSNGTSAISLVPVKQIIDNEGETEIVDSNGSEKVGNTKQVEDQLIFPKMLDNENLPEVPDDNIHKQLSPEQPSAEAQCDNRKDIK